ELDGNPFGSLVTARAVRDGMDTALVGYICFWVVFEELRLMNLAVDPAARRQGVAAELVRHALAAARDRGALRAILEVRASNVPARRLYEQAGFRQIALRAKYYTHPVEDAVIMGMEPLEAASSKQLIANSPGC
ncbi:MAG: ribosomal protein S18-alanine N-acetyltransferase, partial [Nitrospiraceae bacterium]